ncbi:hypothetical protein [Nocardioides sp.]|uniref:hypothetical protein n=1 Tax=Nocardioides sp. TaxID=35761 RepID=UPI002610197F|nr:hypothetical protein [Nocardioides sp.]MCW2738279.1 family N-acetyltransferase [Nocardioides sp.]
MVADDRVLRAMRPVDVAAVLGVQEPAAVAGLSDVFPQHLHPFPREVIADRWRAELRDPAVDCSSSRRTTKWPASPR